MWKTAIYEFRPENGFKNYSYSKVIIDVTQSAPPMTKPGAQLVNVFNRIMKRRDPKSTMVLDLGAARLRNSKYFVEKGFQVYSADFFELYKKGSKTEERLLELKKIRIFIN